MAGSSLIKPDAASLSDPKQALLIVLRLFEAVSTLQNAASASSIIVLGALTVDPGVPPFGKVYEYTIGGSLKVRTATNIYVLAA